MSLQRLHTINCKTCLSCRQWGRGFSRSASRCITLSPVRYELRLRLAIEMKGNSRGLLPVRLHSAIEETQGGFLDEDEGEEDDDLCPVECVKEFKTDEEFLKILNKAKDTLVVVDFYRTSCGSCKYIEQGFSKLCKRAGNDDAGVIFLKHNVIDEYDEESEVADRLRIRSVPLFHFYKNGVLLEAFPTRDKERITEAILKYSTPLSPLRP